MKAENEAARNGAASIEVRLEEDMKESHRRVHPDVRLVEVLEDGPREEGIGVEVRQHHTVG
jgi:hypothetical protein